MRREALVPAPALDRHTRFLLAAIGAVWLFVLLGGGSARADVLYVVAVRLAAVAGIVFLLLSIPAARFQVVRAPLVFTALVALAIGVQLVPLPHAIWSALPGREPYTVLDSVPEIGPVWRPLSLSPDMTWNSFLALLPPLFFVLGVATLHHRHRSWVLQGLLISILVSALLGLFQMAGGPASDLRWYPVTNVDSATGFFANRNHQAVFLAMGIPLTAWWSMRKAEGRRFAPALAIAASVVLFLFVAVVATKSRMGLAASGVAVLLSGAYVLRRVKLRTRSMLMLGGVVAVGAILAAIGLANWSANRLSWSSVQDDLRFRILPESLDAAATFFPTGAGFGAFANVFRRFESVEDLDPTYVNHTHSELTQLVIEGGAMPVVLFLIFFGWYVWACWRVWRGPKDGGDRADTGRLASVLLIVPLFASVSDYPVRAPLMACAVAVAATVLHLVARSGGAPPKAAPTA